MFRPIHGTNSQTYIYYMSFLIADSEDKDSEIEFSKDSDD